MSVVDKKMHLFVKNVVNIPLLKLTSNEASVPFLHVIWKRAVLHAEVTMLTNIEKVWNCYKDSYDLGRGGCAAFIGSI